MRDSRIGYRKDVLCPNAVNRMSKEKQVTV